MKFEEAWFVLTLLRTVREPCPLFGKVLHGEIKEREILQELGWVENE